MEQQQRQSPQHHVPAGDRDRITAPAGETAEHGAEGHGQRCQQHPAGALLPSRLQNGEIGLKPPVLKQWGRHPQADDSGQTHHQTDPANRVDRLSKQPAGQQGHDQRLGIDQHRTETGTGALQPLGQAELKQNRIHQGEQQEPTAVPWIDRQ